jgi:hypothetical protein
MPREEGIEGAISGWGVAVNNQIDPQRRKGGRMHCNR